MFHEKRPFVCQLNRKKLASRPEFEALWKYQDKSCVWRYVRHPGSIAYLLIALAGMFVTKFEGIGEAKRHWMLR
jgi:hypothetical protein